MGPHGEQQINDNGRKLIHLCENNNFKITNGFYKHKEIHKYTWTQRTRNLKSIIDYVICRQHTRLQVYDVRAVRGVTCGSDHFLVRAKIMFPMSHKKHDSVNIKQEIEKIPFVKYNIDSFTHHSTQILYKNRLDEKLQEKENQSFEDTYSNIITSIHAAAQETLGEKRKLNSNKIWWNEQIEDLVKQKKELYLKWLSTKKDEDHNEYKKMTQLVKKTIIKEKNNIWEKKCQEINAYIGGRRCTEAWRFIKTIKSNEREQVNIDLIEHNKWVDHYKTLLTEDRQQYMNYDLSTPILVEGETINVDLQTVKKAITKLKNGKASGPEGIPAELIKFGTEKLFRLLTKTINMCLNGHPVPEQWKEAYISSIHKKGNKRDCNNYRGISVTSTLSRLYGRIIRDIIEQEYQEHQEEEQSGFRAGRSCTDNVFCLKQIIEKKTATNRDVHLTFVDLQKAYDNIPTKKLWEVLQESNISHTIIKAIQNLYEGSKSRIKVRNDLSQQFLVTKGLRQGCCVSPTLFKIYAAAALKQWKRKVRGMGIQLNDDMCLYTLQFADDQVVLANDKDDMEYMVRKLIQEYFEWGLAVNIDKTKYLCVGETTDNLHLDDKEISTCKEYKYLGVTFTDTGTDEREIDLRIVQARKAISCLNSILWSKEITKKRKYNIYESMIKSTLLYGAETWRLTERYKKKIEAVEMDAIRRSLRISRMDKIRNEIIKERMGIEGTIIDDIERKQLTWYGHVNRMHEGRLPKLTMEWQPQEKKKRGRPKTSWGTEIRKAMSVRNLEQGQWENRKEWILGIGQRRKTL